MAEIMISNKMSTIYTLKGYGESTFDTDVTVGVYTNSDMDVEVAVRATGTSDIPVELSVVYAGFSGIEVEVQPIIFSEIEVEVEVNPVNTMSVIYEVIEPSIITYEVETLKDTFIADNSPYDVINFGGNNSMKVGKDAYGNNTSYIAFDISEVPISKIIKNVRMRVFYTNYQDVELTLNKVNSSWSEYGLTYRNDATNITPIDTSYTVNKNDRYIDFDVTEEFKNWYMGLPNNGLAITSENILTLFRAKESDLAPVLVVEYYSDDIYSINSSKVLVDVSVIVSANSEIDVDVDVISKYQNSEILVEVTSHQVNDILNSDIEVDVEVPLYESQSEIEVVVTSTVPDDSSIEVDVEVIALDGESLVDVEVTVISEGESSIDVEVEVEAEGTMYGYSSIDVDFEISDGIPKDGYNEILVSLEVLEKGTYSSIEVEVSVYGIQESTIEVEVEVSHFEDNSDIDVDVFVNIKEAQSSIDVEFAVVDYGDSSIDVEVMARVLDISDVFVDVTVIVGGKKNIYCYKL